MITLCLAAAAALMAPLGASGSRAEVAMLKKIASRISDSAGVIAIEASDPVPYVASQPDPRTFVVELRDVVALGFADNVTVDPRHPVAAVKVESAQAADGASVARIRMTLTQPTRPRVRTARNMIYVEADRLDRLPTTGGAISTAGPASAIRDVRVMRRGAATAVVLLGTGPLAATSVTQPKDGKPRLVIDLPNVTSALPAVTKVGQGPVGDVHIGINPKAPLVTQVVMDLARPAPYRLESSPDGNDLTVVFDDPSAEPFTALATAQTPVAPARPRQAPTAAQAPQVPDPPVPAPLPAPQTPAGGAAPQRFTGNPVSLDFQGADLRAVLRTFAEISGLNLVIDPTIQGTVDVALRDVPWDQALDIILRANRLGYVVDGTIVRVAPLTALQAEEEERRKLADAQALAGTLQTLTRSLSYARGEALTPLITATVLSQRGSIQTDVRTNTIIITDLADRLARANDLLTTLDRPEPQVEIEARIVQTTREFARAIGVQWGFNGRASQALGNTVPLSFPNQIGVGGRTGTSQGEGADATASVVKLGVDGATSALGLALGSVNGAVNLDVALTALERQGQGRLLSTPRVSTQNNVEAEITQGVQIPIQTVANNTVTVTFKDAALTLRVTPQITAADTVIMRIAVENAAPDFSRSVNFIPPIDTQRAVTQVLVSNGDTTVIGGIYVSREQALQDRTPALHRIPLLGWLFKRDSVTDESRELLIFITPRIVRL
ncbi:MAG TPA: type IV pilus secretin PilQ [Vicinamibacterales bacterium]